MRTARAIPIARDCAGGEQRDGVDMPALKRLSEPAATAPWKIP